MLLIAAAEVGAILTVATTATAAMPATAAMHPVAILTAVALVVAIPGILLRLPATTRDERRQPAHILPAFIAAALTATMA